MKENIMSLLVTFTAKIRPRLCSTFLVRRNSFPIFSLRDIATLMTFMMTCRFQWNGLQSDVTKEEVPKLGQRPQWSELGRVERNWKTEARFEESGKGNFWNHTVSDFLSFSQNRPNKSTYIFQKQESYLKPLVDQYAKQGKDKKVTFEAVFSKPNAKPKWFFRKDVSISWIFQRIIVLHSSWLILRFPIGMLPRI